MIHRGGLFARRNNVEPVPNGDITTGDLLKDIDIECAKGKRCVDMRQQRIHMGKKNI